MSRAEDSATPPRIADAEWLERAPTRAVFAALTAEGALARAVGGAVRNTLMGAPVKDVDIATTAAPEEVMRLAERAGLHAIPTGIAHGTVTVVADKVPFEVTTLRRDIETFGRRAKVTFTTDWREDAMRRDFTMNALYCDADGTVHDPLGGYGDLKTKRVRFIGDARQRIREDFLRILRFFRFGAQYGDAHTPDAEGLAAAAAEKAGLAQLSGERIRSELLLLLAAPAVVPALNSMREIGIVEPLLGVPGDIALVERLAAIEAELQRAPDPLLRLAALASGTREDLGSKLRLSSADADRLAGAARRDDAFQPKAGEAIAKAFIYRHGAQTFTDGALLAWARSGDGPTDPGRIAHATLPERWSAPALPVRGADVVALGVPAGPGVGRVVAGFEAWWMGAGYPEDAGRVRAKLEELARGELQARRDP
ncbi:MAG: CCA tRNA nucleotidyltransferase [Hyphomicrobium sp.]